MNVEKQKQLVKLHGEVLKMLSREPHEPALQRWEYELRCRVIDGMPQGRRRRAS